MKHDSPSSRRSMKAAAGLGAVALLAVVLPAIAFAADPSSGPVIIIEKPGQCVADTEVMRRDHMNFLMHQRDRTVRDGVRTRQFSLKACVECHASVKTGSVLGKDGFCQSCHVYAGVKLDCFECHASRPKSAAGVAHPAGPFAGFMPARQAVAEELKPLMLR